MTFKQLGKEIKMSNPINKSKGPGVYIPPPLFYIIIFIVSVLIQKQIPIADSLFHTVTLKVVGLFFIIISLFFSARSLRQFIRSKNTLILIKPATTLQTTGIYEISRNPMYMGLIIIYLGITCFIGNWWNIILLPLLIVIIQEYVIKHEEKYLHLEFGQQYEEYKKKVRRWL
jgi:protein-S-isoprenylcysteine O-methyltransferase Ste14